ncbi:ATP-dependent helicase [Ruminiclostridium cellulolyticum]|uniref:DNA 3'-5' helicase n=1 Tax=Ruminiclostridium cellulolyticum (strain ATCC 35319 / DSM 5812 / JCM 6584 / H10) TaxID=394503 RepID=B8I7B7_RUMCH|nr:ATP-dependent helicase [Ruminiclostridium cellulolyticum]ACL75041.1 UvrD/REP helicase [Ruminiclostridium cellulolyticum H10]
MTQSEIDWENNKLREIINKEAFKDLSTEQRKAVLTVEGSVLLIAGPGSGKTTVIVNRVYNLIKYERVNPKSILTLTFNKAAQLEMDRRFQKLYGNHVKEKVQFSTLHSFCNRVVRDYEIMKGRSLRRIEGTDENVNKKILLKDIYYSINSTKINDDELDNLINEISYIKNKMIKNGDDSYFSSKKFSKVYRAYEEHKKQNLMIDFDDMLTYAYSILSRFPQILDWYKKRYTYIQVDEGQDLSNIQFAILKLLSGPDGNIFIVADDDQSIYRFRGAEPQYILDMSSEFNNLKLFRLENNYRSSLNIVDLTSKFIMKNDKRYLKSHKTKNKRADDPFILSVENESGQSDIVLKKISELLTGNRSISIGILYRNNLSSILVADKLQRNSISFRIRQNRLFFFRHWLVQEVCAFLMFSLDGYDTESFTKICFRMNRFISKTMLECALQGEERDNVIDRIINNHDLKPFQLTAMRDLKGEFASLAKKNPWSALEYIKNDFRYLESVKEYSSISGQSFDYFNRLFGILHGISVDCPTISAFLVRLQELEKIFEAGGVQNDWEKNQITLSTLHSSKGLEYDSVFMIDMINSEIPGDKVLENSEKITLEEERRLFYVGMTRAKKDLYLLNPCTLNDEKFMPSIFINEVVQLLQKDIINNISEGKFVNHVKFGRGMVVAINKEHGSDRHMIEIKFFKVGCRKLDLQHCIDKKLLKFE